MRYRAPAVPGHSQHRAVAMKVSKQLRSTIRLWALARGDAYRVMADGQVHVHGQMPNSVETGWWFAGYADRWTE